MRQKSDNPCKNSYKNKAYSSSFSGFPGGTVIKNLPANAGDTRDTSSMPGLGRSPGGGHGHPLQYACLENPRDRGSWGYSPWVEESSDVTEHTHIIHLEV